MSLTTKQKRTRNVWPRDAFRLIQRAKKTVDPQKNVLLLHEQLQTMTNFSAYSCWSFLGKHGFRRPKAGTYHSYDGKSLECVMENGYDLTVERFGGSKKGLYNYVRRQNRNVGHTGTDYTVFALSKLLTIREAVIKSWIASGQLQSNEGFHGGRRNWRITTDQLKEFLTTHAAALVLNSRVVPEKRLEFLTDFCYQGKHMDLGLLHTRESKKENEAFDNGEYHLAVPRSFTRDSL